MYTCGHGVFARRLMATFSGSPDQDGNDLTFALPGDTPTYAPDRPADVRHVDIAVRLDFDAQSVAGDVTTTFRALFQEVREVTLDAAELDVSDVTLGDGTTSLRYWTEREKLHIALDRPYPYGEEFAVRVRYSARPRTGLVFVKPTEGDPSLPVQAWTQGETEYHHYWLPVHDFPNDRATTAMHATVPSAFFALSNGRLEGVDDHADGTHTFHWRQDVPFPAYLITLVAGEFAELPDTWRDRPIPSYVRPGREEDGRRMFAKTGDMLEYFSTRFGVEYPYVKYAQIVAELFLGAMENVSATTHSYRLLPDARASIDFTPEPVVAHEMVHQWHGDLLAVRDWSNTWLKEASADYFASTWTQHDKGDDEFKQELHDYLHAYLEADARGRRPIVYNVYRKNGNELFDRHVYEKGALVWHMLRNVLGEEPFWRGVQLYTQRNRDREVITADLERALEEATGRSLAHFFEQWLYKAGHPEFTVTYSWDDVAKQARIGVRQTQTVTEHTPVFATPVDLGFFVPDSDATDASASLVTVRVTVEGAEQTFFVPLARRPLSVRFDQGGWLIKTLTFERPFELLRYQLTHDPDMLGRIEAAEALGKLGDRRSVEALGQALLDEPFWGVKDAIAGALGSQKSEQALNALLVALARITEPKARRAIVAALGNFRVPEQGALAERAAVKLTEFVQNGDPSYFVEATAATSLGKTRTPGAFETLVSHVDRSSWNEVLRSGVFAGLGELADSRSVDMLASWMLDRTKPMDARWAAANGMRALAATRRIDGEAKTRAVDAAIAALRDPWTRVVMASVAALAAFGDARAIPELEALIARDPDEHVVRAARVALQQLRKGNGASDEARRLREDLEKVRDENRTLRERLDALESRMGSGGSAR